MNNLRMVMRQSDANFMPPGLKIASPRSSGKRRNAMLQKSPMYAYIPARDVARARKFYEEKIGLKPREIVAGGVIYEFGDGTACFLYPTPNAGTSQASQAFWEVEDVEREVAELRSRGVEFEDY